MIDSPHACLSGNWRTITWVSNCTYPIFELFVIGYPLDSYVNCACIMASFALFLTVSKLIKALQTFSLKRSSPKTFLVPKFVIGARARGCPITGVRFELFVIGYSRDLHVNYARFNGFFAMFRTVFNNFEKRYRYFRPKELPKRHFF